MMKDLPPRGTLTPSFLSELFNSVTDRGRALLRRRAVPVQSPQSLDAILLGEMLLSRRGEASGVGVADMLLSRYATATQEERIAFLRALGEKFGADRARTDAAIAAFQRNGDADALAFLHESTESRRQELFRRINLAPHGTAALVAMRAELLDHVHAEPRLGAVDRDFVHLFASWFNRGFLTLRPIDWTTPAHILEKIIRYEAVHEIHDWNDLRNRLQPSDRRCYAFFHPQLVDEPLIFVEVALTRDMPEDIRTLLAMDRSPIAAAEATMAAFYSISNTQKGLTGISFGNFLIKHVVETLKLELPGLKKFVTLSPVPRFAAWLRSERQAEISVLLPEIREALATLDEARWHTDPAATAALREPMLHAAAQYFLQAKTAGGKPIDPVARFHLGNGARLEQLNFLADPSPQGLQQAHGLMVNYLYAPDEIETNHEAFAERGRVAASAGIRQLLHPPAR